MIKKVFRIFLIVFLVSFLVVGALIFALRYPTVQTYIAQRFTTILSKSLNTKVSIERVEISFFNKADLVNFYLEDYNKDTLISAKELKIEFKIFDLWNKKISVSKILLDGGTVHLHLDSTGEKMNLTELFKNFNSNKAKADTTTKKSKFTWKMDLKELELRATDFRYLDDRSHTDIKVLVPSCEISMNSVSLENKLIYIKSARIDGTDVRIDLDKHEKTADDDSILHLHFMPDGMQLKFDEFALTHTRFRMNDHNNDTISPKGMDFKHLDVSDINLLANDGSIIADTILTNVKQLTAKERSGFELKELATEMRVSVNEITLDKLNLKTGNSEVKNYLSFRFSAYHDFKDFLNAIRIKANFDGTKLSLRDLNYFIPKLDKVEHNRIAISGELDGRINNLKGRGIEIRTGQNTIFKGDFYTRGLPNIYETSLNVRVNRLATTASDIQKFYPGIKIPDNLNTLGLIYYSGSLDGFLTDFVSNGKMVTSIGSATTDVNFKYDKKNNKASYKGNLALNEFELGKYFRDETNLGRVSLRTKINGRGLTLESLHAELDGNVSSIVLRGYDYRNIKVNGFVLKKSFTGSLSIHDLYLDMDFNGTADLSKQTPEFNFSADIRKAMLKNLNILKEDVEFSGKMTSDFIGSKADDIIGSVELEDVTIRRDTTEATVHHLKLDAKFLAADKKEISLNSDFAEVELNGHFSFKELPKALLYFARYTYLKDYVDTSSISPQDFSFDVRIFEPGTLTQIIYPNFKLIRNSHIAGDFNSVDHKLNLTAFIPEFKFADYNIKRTDVNTHSENGKIVFKTSIDKVYNGDSLMLDTVNLWIRTQENKDIRLDALIADKKKFNYANITAFLTPLTDKAVVHLEPSDVKLGNYNWRFDAVNSIFIEGKKITTNNLAFRTFDQTIYISSYLKGDTSTCFKLTLDNTDISDFTGIFTKKMTDMSGALNGKLVVEDVFYKPKIYADLVLNEFTLAKELIGDVNIESRLDESGKKILLYVSVKSINNNLEARGFVSIDPLHPDLKIDINASHLGLNFLNYKFFDRYVKNCRGYAIVNARVEGTLKKPLLLGEVDLINDTVTVSFLNTTYHIHKHKVYLDELGFKIGDITIFDHRNLPIYGSGRINHNSFRNFALDIKVNTENGQFLNTTASMSPGFYGIAYGKGGITFWGDINSPVIRATAVTSAGTYCKLPINTSYEINKYGFYRFVHTDEKKPAVNISAPQLKLSGVDFMLNLTATPDARMDIVLDPVAGDVLTTYGKGDLEIHIPRNGTTTMRGNYEIERGSYLFTLQNIINKHFEISRGSTINFTGEVTKASLNVNAVYELRSSVSDLIQDQIDAQNTTNTGTPSQQSVAARSRVPVQLWLNLTGILEKPNIAFDIKTIDVDPTIKTYVDQKLALLKTNDSEMNKQAFGLLLMNRFLPPTASATDLVSKGNYAGGTAANTVSEFLSSQLSNYMSNLFEYTGNSALQNLDINIGFRQYDQSVTNISPNPTQQTLDTRRELKLALQQRLLNNRLTINAGGNLDFGNSTTVEGGISNSKSTVIPTGDFQIQYALTPDGAWSAKAFNRTNYDYFNSRNTNRTGIGLAYRQEFDKPAEIFRKKSKKEKKKK